MKTFIYLLTVNQDIKPPKAYSTRSSAEKAMKGMITRKKKSIKDSDNALVHRSRGITPNSIAYMSLYTYKTWTNNPKDIYVWLGVTITKVQLFGTVGEV